MLASLVGRDIMVRLETGEGPLKHVHSPLRCRVLHALGATGGAATGGADDGLEVDILQPPHESLRGGRLRLSPHDPAEPVTWVMQGREVVVQVELHLPRIGHISDGIGSIEPLQ
jgi:hypothetical protein